MKEYPKIQSIYKRDEKYKQVVGIITRGMEMKKHAITHFFHVKRKDAKLALKEMIIMAKKLGHTPGICRSKIQGLEDKIKELEQERLELMAKVHRLGQN